MIKKYHNILINQKSIKLGIIITPYFSLCIDIQLVKQFYTNNKLDNYDYV